MKALMSIEGFRSLNSDIETTINKSEHVKNVKKTKGEDITPKEKKQLSEEEKEYKSKRKEIQEKLIKFATRIPVFMYLTDYREYCLKDVIMQLEPELFRKVTGLTLKDFSLLISLNVFNSKLMNDAVYKFKRYEDDSLEYTGISTHDGRMIGGWDTVIDMQKIKAEPVVEVPVSKDVQNASSVPDDRPTVTEEPQPTKSWKDISIGATVTHKSLGPGTVMSLDEKYIIIKFRDRESKFFYPGAFERGYLEC